MKTANTKKVTMDSKFEFKSLTDSATITIEARTFPEAMKVLKNNVKNVNNYSLQQIS